MKLIILALVAVGCWTLAAFFAWAVVRVGTRDDPPEWPEDGIQPGDTRTFTLAAGSFRYYDGWPPYPPTDVNN